MDSGLSLKNIRSTINCFLKIIFNYNCSKNNIHQMLDFIKHASEKKCLHNLYKVQCTLNSRNWKGSTVLKKTRTVCCPCSGYTIVSVEMNGPLASSWRVQRKADWSQAWISSPELNLKASFFPSFFAFAVLANFNTPCTASVGRLHASLCIPAGKGLTFTLEMKITRTLWQRRKRWGGKKIQLKCTKNTNYIDKQNMLLFTK